MIIANFIIAFNSNFIWVHTCNDFEANEVALTALSDGNARYVWRTENPTFRQQSSTWTERRTDALHWQKRKPKAKAIERHKKHKQQKPHSFPRHRCVPLVFGPPLRVYAWLCLAWLSCFVVVFERRGAGHTLRSAASGSRATALTLSLTRLCR